MQHRQSTAVRVVTNSNKYSAKIITAMAHTEEQFYLWQYYNTLTDIILTVTHNDRYHTLKAILFDSYDNLFRKTQLHLTKRAIWQRFIAESCQLIAVTLVTSFVLRNREL